MMHTPSPVLMASAEDDPANTIVPRLMAARADLERVGLLDLTQSDEHGQIISGTIALPGDVPLIAEHVKRLGARLVVIDRSPATSTVSTAPTPTRRYAGRSAPSRNSPATRNAPSSA